LFQERATVVKFHVPGEGNSGKISCSRRGQQWSNFMFQERATVVKFHVTNSETKTTFSRCCKALNAKYQIPKSRGD